MREYPSVLEMVRRVRPGHIRRLQEVLGVNPQGNAASVAERLDGLDGGGGSEVLSVGPEGDISFTEDFVGGPTTVIGEEGAPAFENGWESSGEHYFEGLGTPNDEGEGHKTYLEGSFQHTGASAATIFTLPPGHRPLKKVEQDGLVIEVDGKVHLAVAGEAIEVGFSFDSEFEAEAQPVAELIPGVEVTVTKDPDGTVLVRGTAKKLRNPQGSVVVLPDGFRPAQIVFAAENIEVRADGKVVLPSEEAGGPDLPAESAFLFDSLPPFKAAA